MGILRHYATILLKSDPVIDVAEAKLKSTLARSSRFRMNYDAISPSAVAMRRVSDTSKIAFVMQTNVAGTITTFLAAILHRERSGSSVPTCEEKHGQSNV